MLLRIGMAHQAQLLCCCSFGAGIRRTLGPDLHDRRVTFLAPVHERHHLTKGCAGLGKRAARETTRLRKQLDTEGEQVVLTCNRIVPVPPGQSCPCSAFWVPSLWALFPAWAAAAEGSPYCLRTVTAGHQPPQSRHVAFSTSSEPLLSESSADSSANASMYLPLCRDISSCQAMETQTNRGRRVAGQAYCKHQATRAPASEATHEAMLTWT